MVVAVTAWPIRSDFAFLLLESGCLSIRRKARDADASVANSIATDCINVEITSAWNNRNIKAIFKAQRRQCPPVQATQEALSA
jgi:hypothetical protein